jgi:putative phage-type endonuclease
MPHDGIAQGTEEWRLQRLGKATASRVGDIVAKTKTGWGASRYNYAAQLIAERLTGVPYEGYSNAAMQWGVLKEPEARAAYAFFTGRPVIEVGFIPHPGIAMSGCSCDGFIADDGLFEAKCPNTSTHIETLLGEPIEKKYIIQMQWQMACTGKAWCDFVSFDPRLPPELQLKIQRVTRDDEHIMGLSADVIEFLHEIDAKMKALTSLMEAA